MLIFSSNVNEHSYKIKSFARSNDYNENVNGKKKNEKKEKPFQHPK